MLIRIVKMTFREDCVPLFLSKFNTIKHKIRRSRGCSHLEIWEDYHNTSILTSYSMWESENDLNRYRHSDFFRQTWSEIKPWFAEKPVAYSFKKKLIL